MRKSIHPSITRVTWTASTTGKCWNCGDNATVSTNGRGNLICSACHQIDRDIESYQQDKEELNRCQCGSGKQASWEYDARGIELCKACPKCRRAKLSGYRPEILSGYDESDVDEPIESDEVPFLGKGKA